MSENCNENCIEWIKGSEFAGVTASEMHLKIKFLNLQRRDRRTLRLLPRTMTAPYMLIFQEST